MKVICRNPECDSDTFRDIERGSWGSIIRFWIVVLIPLSFIQVAFGLQEFKWEIFVIVFLPIYLLWDSYLVPRFAKRRRVECVECGTKDWRSF